MGSGSTVLDNATSFVRVLQFIELPLVLAALGVATARQHLAELGIYAAAIFTGVIAGYPTPTTSILFSGGFLAAVAVLRRGIRKRKAAFNAETSFERCDVHT
jgi:hypothetical protein